MVALPGTEFNGDTQKILSMSQGHGSRCTDNKTFPQLENLPEQLQGALFGWQEDTLFCSSSQNSPWPRGLAAEALCGSGPVGSGWGLGSGLGCAGWAEPPTHPWAHLEPALLLPSVCESKAMKLN